MTARPFVIVTLLLLTAAPAGSQSAAREALDGIDPVVLLTQGKEVSGKPELKVTRGRFDYLFASADTKAIFEKTPERFEIQLSGACARIRAAWKLASDGHLLSRRVGTSTAGRWASISPRSSSRASAATTRQSCSCCRWPPRKSATSMPAGRPMANVRVRSSSPVRT